jgi:hypothetical protein
MLRLAAPCLALVLASSATAQSGAADVKSEAVKLRAAAEAKAKEIGKITASGNLTGSDEALKLLQQAVDELKEIRERLKTLEGAQEKTAKTVAQSTPKLKLGGYAQFQYQDTDRKGANRFDAFAFRRLRINLDGPIAPRVGAKVSFDLAAGANQTQEQLRDAWFSYDFSGGSRLGRDRAYVGQFAIPVGYEMEKSDADNEFPERVQYNQVLFNTERSRGVKLRRDGRDGLFQVGVVDALAIGDPEQANLASGAGDRLAVFAQGRVSRGNTSVGLSGFAGERPAYTAGGATSPKVDRRFAYLDLEQRDLLFKGFTLRGVLLRGNDRIPNATANPAALDHPLSGYHLLGAYRLSSLDQLVARWEAFDPNLDATGDALHGYGLTYLRNLTPELRLGLTHEIFVDESRAANFNQTRYGVTTIRLQVRF